VFRNGKSRPAEASGVGTPVYEIIDDPTCSTVSPTLTASISPGDSL